MTSTAEGNLDRVELLVGEEVRVLVLAQVGLRGRAGVGGRVGFRSYGTRVSAVLRR